MVKTLRQWFPPERGFGPCLVRWGLALALLSHSTLQALSIEEFRRQLAAYLDRPAFAHSWWGVHLESLESGAVLFTTNAHRLFQPGSTAKLLTAALALDRFGPDHRVATLLLARQPADPDGVLHGDLVVSGRGDFSFTRGFWGGGDPSGMDRLVAVVKAAGIRRVQGDLIGDSGWFPAGAWGAGWAWDDLKRGYATEPTALVFDDNRVEVTKTLGGAERTVSRAVANPAARFVETLRERLRAAGIEVEGRADARGRSPDLSGERDLGATVEIGRTWSPPMRDLVRAMVKDSSNLYAQLLLMQVGTIGIDTTGGDTTRPEDPAARGLEALEDLVKRAGLDPAEVRLEEAAGLSRASRVSPAALVALLRWMDQHAAREAFLHSLPIAGVDGTLKTRFRGTAAAGNLRAKTGWLSDVSALAGRVQTRTGETVLFSLMLNAYAAPSAEAAAEAVDSVAVWLTELDEATP